MTRSLLIALFTAAALHSDGLVAQQPEAFLSPLAKASAGVTVTPVIGRRAILRNPNVAAVLPFGRRGILGLRPQGHLIIGRTPVTVYRRDLAVQPPTGFGYRLDGAAVPPLPPIGAGQQFDVDYGPWSGQASSFDEDRWLDQTHQEIERNLRPSSGAYGTEDFRPQPPGPIVEPIEPEELPLPSRTAPSQASRAASALLGQARDIARPRQSTDIDRLPAQPKVPPPPQPDPPNQSASAVASSSAARPNAQSAPAAIAQPENSPGPRLQDPNTGTGDF